ncbi:hypothetical protein D0S45_05725 [Marinifilum sp. JC120]|nr:hypothetical protein D0S45_05725 [Marinifilum sp. JC120]
MRLAIMQPYFFPYVGYFQLIDRVDKFVVLDDVNFITRGWVNRNQILLGGKPSMFSLPLEKASQNKLICEIEIAGGYERWAQKFLKTIKHAYKSAPFFETAYEEVVRESLNTSERNLSAFIVATLKIICSYCKIQTDIIETSRLYPKADLTGADRIIDICRRCQATTYINPSGGSELYDVEVFAKHGIELQFFDPVISEYSHGGVEFISHLSIVDLIMWREAGSIY